MDCVFNVDRHVESAIPLEDVHDRRTLGDGSVSFPEEQDFAIALSEVD